MVRFYFVQKGAEAMPVIKWVQTENCNVCMKRFNIKPENNLKKLQYLVRCRNKSTKCNGCGRLEQIKKVIENERS